MATEYLEKHLILAPFKKISIKVCTRVWHVTQSKYVQGIIKVFC